MYYCSMIHPLDTQFSTPTVYRTKANLPGNCKIALEANFAPSGIF